MCSHSCHVRKEWGMTCGSQFIYMMKCLAEQQNDWSGSNGISTANPSVNRRPALLPFSVPLDACGWCPLVRHDGRKFVSENILTSGIMKPEILKGVNSNLFPLVGIQMDQSKSELRPLLNSGSWCGAVSSVCVSVDAALRTAWSPPDPAHILGKQESNLSD